MSKTTVMTRKDMKEPDKFQVAATQAASWLVSRKKHLVVAAAVAVAVLIAVAGVSAYRASREAEAGKAIASLLSAMGGQISAVPLAGEPGPFYANEEEKQRAVLQAADGVASRYAGTGPGYLAALAKADAHLKLRDWDAAQKAYEGYLAAAPKDDSLRFGGLEGAALAAAGEGDLDGAARAYERMGQEAPAFADRADLERARILAQAGRTADAKQLLASFPEKHPDSLLGPGAAAELAKLGGK
jgi:tetratricopeptide (TPR) repeat protein